MLPPNPHPHVCCRLPPCRNSFRPHLRCQCCYRHDRFHHPRHPRCQYCCRHDKFHHRRRHRNNRSFPLWTLLAVLW